MRYRFLIRNGKLFRPQLVREFLPGVKLEFESRSVDFEVLEIDDGGFEFFDYYSLTLDERENGVTVRKFDEVSNLVVVAGGRARGYVKTSTPLVEIGMRYVMEFMPFERRRVEELAEGVGDDVDEIFYFDEVYGLVSVKFFLGSRVREKIWAKKLRGEILGYGEFFSSSS